MNFNCLLLTVGLVVQAATVLSQTQDPRPDPNFHLYLLIGQSNMSGRGAADAESKETNARVLMLTKDLTWKPAIDPLHFDKSVAGVGPGLTFGKEMARSYPQARIGLIPCAVGGTSIKLWVAGAHDKVTQTHPYDDMLKRVREAQKYGQLKGILWHQGEADRSDSNYGQALTDLVGRLRRELGAPNVPFVAGELGTFNPKNRAITENFNVRLQSLTNTIDHYACVSAEGLHDRGDHLHFDTASARILGRRYADMMLKLESETSGKPF